MSTYRERFRKVYSMGYVEAQNLVAEADAEIADLCARLQEARAERDAAREEREALREALVGVVRAFPTDSDLYEAGWTKVQVDYACDAYDLAKAAIDAARKESK